MIERDFVKQKKKEYQIQEFVVANLSNVGHSKTRMQRTPLGEKIIEVYATDAFGWSGSLATFTITITKSRAAYNNLLIRLLDMFPILRHL